MPKQLSYTVDKDSGVPYEQVYQVLKENYPEYAIVAGKSYTNLDKTKYYLVISKTKTIKIDYIDTTTHEVIKQTSYTVPAHGAVSEQEVEANVPAGYLIDPSQIGHDQAQNKYYVGVYKEKAAIVTPTPKTPTKTPAPTKTATKAATTTSAKKATKTLPKTGDTTNTVASSIGVVAVIGALFGLAGTTKKRA